MFVDNWFDDMTRVSRFKMSKKSNDFGLEDTLTRTKKVKMPSTNTSFFDDRYIDNEMAKFQYHNEFLADVDEFDKKYMPNIDFSHTDPQLYQYKLKGKTMNDLIMDKVRGIDPTVESGDNGMVANKAKVLATLRKGGSSSTSTSSSSGGGGKGTGAVHIDDESGVGGGGGGVLNVNTAILTGVNYTILVGAGGAYSSSPVNGSNSTFSAVANVAIGGGGGD